jgi:hypothetical protein
VDRRTLVHAEDVRDLAQGQVLIVVESNYQLLALWEPGYGLCDLISHRRIGKTGLPAIRCKRQRLRFDPSGRNMSCKFRDSSVQLVECDLRLLLDSQQLLLDVAGGGAVLTGSP